MTGPSEQRLDVQWDKLIDPDIRALTISTAFDALQEEVRRGFDDKPLVVTDGIPQRAPNQVKAFGKIEFIARQDPREIARWVMFELTKRSPVVTGAYVAAHHFMINGEVVQDLGGWKPGDVIDIVNSQPYARKLEGLRAKRKPNRRGDATWAGRRGASRQAPGGVYRVVERLAKARFGRQIWIEMRWVRLNLGVTSWRYSGGSKYAKIKRGVAHVYPSIRVKTNNTLLN